MDSYDNDYLFIDDDLFLLAVPACEVENDPNITMIYIGGDPDALRILPTEPDPG